MRKALSHRGVVIILCVLVEWSSGGITTVICSGRVWVEPAPVFEMGLNVSILCQSALQNCQPRKFHLYKSSKGIQDKLRMAKLNQTTARLQLSDFREPRAHVICRVECPRQEGERLICGEDMASGYPPGVPSNLTCLIYEHSGSMTCTWDTGTPTYLDTKYAVHVKSLQTGEEQLYLTSGYVNISTNTLRSGKMYSVWVQAANALGKAESDHLQLHLDDIVIPALPVITRAEDLNTSVSTTIIHWKIQTSMDGVFCEMRYKAATRPSWNVKELETTSTSMQHIQYNLEPSTKYAFQARCRQPGRRYRQEWSMPFFHTTPEAVPQVSLKSFQGEAHHVVPLSASIFKDHLTSGNRNPTAGLLSAMLFCVTVVSALFLTVIFKQSLRVRIKRRLLLLLPNWLHEDVPNVRNSCAIKTLQEISEFIMNNSSESSLDPDPVITEIEETYLQKEFQPIHSKMETTTEPAATGEDPHTSPLVDVTVAYLPDPSTGYKPQISSLLPGAHPTHKISDPRVSAFESQVNPLGLGKNVVIRNCPSPVFSSTSTNVGRDLFSLKERGLIFDPSESGSVEGPEETEMEALMTLEKQPSRESLPEQTLLPDDLVSCLRARGEEESPDVRPYFPQRFGGLFP
ncbi:interleukin-23 receptor [Phascolarctos cinereus]|uniref:Interleukin-23 receptor isoform X1 n=1 Tax=Phascolarctos cinereus TaxID=38626 RepID=A0A6P5KSF2_PHACI|nr:interleukin-23 receptor isoform X1 [Phascolarctos cinereus]XP_020848643.1 interleukin-23 receptor isoform X1 [Phascolarctos cinereus]